MNKRLCIAFTLIVCLGVGFSLTAGLALADAGTAAGPSKTVTRSVATAVDTPAPAGDAPPNDNCEDAIGIGDGSFAFTTVGATTDGDDVVGLCIDFGLTQIASDIWYCYTAPCTGIATADLCTSADFDDSKMAVYEGCGCPALDARDCDDDGCTGESFLSTLSFSVVQGQQYMVRVGGFPATNEQGTGTLITSCFDTENTCGAKESGDCRNPSGTGTPGCEDAGCCVDVCIADAYCCESDWDDLCAIEAAGLCDGAFADCGAGAGACDSSNGSPGCEDSFCCQAVCEQDIYCCSTTWDQTCSNEADFTPECHCGAGQGDCFSAHETGGCEDSDCCVNICDFSEFTSCCFSAWDEGCAAAAEGICAGEFDSCGPGSGGCFETDGNGTPGCDVDGCCQLVCLQDPFCCVNEWDHTCTLEAVNLCSERGDADFDGDVDWNDYSFFSGCLSGQGIPYLSGCAIMDFDDDGDVDLLDWGGFLNAFDGVTQ